MFCQVNGLRQVVQKGYYKVRKRSKYFTNDTLKIDVKEPLQDGDIIHITPVIGGSGGAVQAIAGAVLIVVGVVFQQYYLVGAGVAMIAGGVAGMLTKTPTPDNPQRNEVEKKQSTSFSNLQNLVAQGRPVPLAYGRIRTGSLVIGKGLETVAVQLVEPEQNVDTNTGKRGLLRA